jgi:hypothetical protein
MSVHAEAGFEDLVFAIADKLCAINSMLNQEFAYANEKPYVSDTKFGITDNNENDLALEFEGSSTPVVRTSVLYAIHYSLVPLEIRFKTTTWENGSCSRTTVPLNVSQREDTALLDKLTQIRDGITEFLDSQTYSAAYEEAQSLKSHGVGSETPILSNFCGVMLSVQISGGKISAEVLLDTSNGTIPDEIAQRGFVLMEDGYAAKGYTFDLNPKPEVVESKVQGGGELGTGEAPAQ